MSSRTHLEGNRAFIRCSVGCALALLLMAASGLADCKKPETLAEWTHCRVQDALAARLNAKSNTNQVEAPSSTTNTTALVDQSTATDLFGAAVNLASLATKSSSGNVSSFSGVASAYAIKAAIDHHDPLDPAYYTENRDLRSFWITLGAQYPDSNSPPGTKPATLAGVKVMLVNGRDLSTSGNREKIRQLFISGGAANVALAATDLAVEQYLYDTIAPMLTLPDNFCKDPTSGQELSQVECDAKKKADFKRKYWTGPDQIAGSVSRFLKEDDLKKIDQIIEERLRPILENIRNINNTVDAIRKAPQLSASFQSTLRSGNAHNAYRGELVFDYGLANRLNLTVNGSYEYDDLRPTGSIQRGGRFALEGQYLLGRSTELRGKGPWTVSLSSQGSWMTAMTPTYKAQAKLKIPIASGVDFPISVTYASRTALIKESDVQGKFGFTFDLSKLLSTLRTASK